MTQKNNEWPTSAPITPKIISRSWLLPGLNPMPARSPSAAFPVNQPAIAPKKIRTRRSNLEDLSLPSLKQPTPFRVGHARSLDCAPSRNGCGLQTRLKPFCRGEEPRKFFVPPHFYSRQSLRRSRTPTAFGLAPSSRVRRAIAIWPRSNWSMIR